MKLKKHLPFALAACLLAILSLTFNSPMHADSTMDFPRIPLVLEGAKVSTEAAAGELAWKSYTELMLKRVAATESVRVTEILTMGFDLPGFAKQNDKVWEARITDATTGLKAILWIHTQSGQVKFLFSSANRESLAQSAFLLPPAIFPDVNFAGAALPDADTIKDVVFEKNIGYKKHKMTAAEFKQWMKFAEPMSLQEYMRHSITDISSHEGTFSTPTGQYRFSMTLGGVNYLTLPNGGKLRFKFPPPPNPF